VQMSRSNVPDNRMEVEVLATAGAESSCGTRWRLKVTVTESTWQKVKISFLGAKSRVIGYEAAVVSRDNSRHTVLT
jgi:hypothetical protein